MLLRARAIENQAFVVAANQVGEHPPGLRSGGRSMIVDPWGVVLAQAPDDEGVIVADLDFERQDEVRAKLPALAHRRDRLFDRGARLMAVTARAQAAADRRRQILDAAVRVFARQGFHGCRVSDIADEAGVAYGLVYHYFRSKEEVLDTLFLERWDVLVATIDEVAAREDMAPRDQLHVIASFIVDSYRYDPDLMKVIIVEVTRAANSFGRTHLVKIREAYDGIAGIVERAQDGGHVQVRRHAAVRRHGLLRGDRAGAHGVDLRPASARPGRVRAGQAVRGRDGLRRAGRGLPRRLTRLRRRWTTSF